MTPQDAITEARDILLDTDSTSYRQSDPELLRYFNEGLLAASVLAPHLFITSGDLTCQAISAEQIVAFTDAQRFVSVLRVKGGNAVTECDKSSLDRYLPGWQSMTGDVAVNWMKSNKADPRRFYVYPPAPSAGQTLVVEYVKIPPAYLLTDTVTVLPPTAKPALVNYIVARAESKDDEHVNSNRAMTHMGLFNEFFAPGQKPQAPQQGA